MKRVMIVLAPLLLALAANAQFTGWSAPANLGRPVNSEYTDTCVQVSKDGLSLYYASIRPTGRGNTDLYVTRRASVREPWGEPKPLDAINTQYLEQCPALSLDEHKLYLNSTRPGGCGGGDLWVSRRHDRREDFGDSGWQEPVNVGCELNSPAGEYAPNLFEDETGAVIIYFTTTRNGFEEIWSSIARKDDTFGPPTPVVELNIPGFNTRSPVIRRDGLEVLFESNRQGGLGSFDIWVATRATTADPWSAPVNVTALNSPASDGGKMSLSFDGKQIYFRSNRPGGYGGYDLYVATREKLRQ